MKRPAHTLEDLFRGMDTGDLEDLVAIYDKYRIIDAESGEVSRVVASA